MLDFAVPGVLWGLTALGIPVALHLLFRQRPVVVKFPAIRFLLATRRQTARRFRLRQLLLLLARMALIGGFVAALAGPRLVEHHPGPRGGRRRVNAVLILDTSYSMSHAGADGSPRFHRAKALALQMLDMLSTDSRLALILCANEPQVAVGAFTFDRAAIAGKIKQSRSTFRPTHCTAALVAAYDLFHSEQITEARAIFLFTDLTANGWPPLPADAHPLAGSTPVYVIDVGDERSENRYLSLVRRSFGTASAGVPFSFEAQVILPAAIGSATVELHVDGELRGEGHVRADGATACAFQLTPSRPGFLAGRVAFRGKDAIAADDRAYFAVPCGARREVLVVDGAAAEASESSGVFFLTRALAPPVPGVPPAVRCDVVAPAGLTKEMLDGVAAVILVDVPSLTAPQWRDLGAHVAGGAGLIVFAGPRLDIASYNTHGRDKLDPHGGLLPCTFGRVVTSSAGFRFRLGGFGHPFLRPFETANPHLGAPVFRACITATAVSQEPSPVILRFENGLPALLEKSHGRGRVLVFTSGAGRRWGNFPRVPHAYVPFVHELLRYVAQAEELPPWHHVGDVVRLTAPGGQRLRSVRVQPPNEGRWAPVPLPRDAQGRFPTSVVLSDTEQPGITLVELTTEQGTSTRLVAVNVAAGESVPDRLTPRQLAELLPGVPVHVFRRLAELREPLEVGGTTTDLNRYLVPLLLVLLVGELLLANRMYGRTPQGAEEAVASPPPLPGRD